MLRNLINAVRGDKTIAIFAFVALAFVAAQSFSAIHAAKYGEGSHEHSGVACVVSVISKSGEKFIGAATIAFAAVVVTWRAAGAVAQTERARIAVRAARPRGPPTR